MNIDVKRKKEKRNFITRYVIYALILYFEYIFSTALTVGFSMPLLMLITAVSISIYEEPLKAALFGVYAGFLIDFAEKTVLGINAILVLWLCLITSLLFRFFMREHIVNIIPTIFLCVIIQSCFRYFFYYFVWKYDEGGEIFLREFLPVIISSFVFIFIIFPIIKRIKNRFGKIDETFIEENSEDIIRE